MTGQGVSLVERLCEAKSPLELVDWEGRDGYYVAACRVSVADVPGLIEIARKWDDLDWPREADPPDIDQEDAELLPVTAWRTLADLKADAAVEPLIDMLRESDDEFDDWVSDELPHVFGKIGESAVQGLTRLASDAREQDFVRSIAARGLRAVADYHTSTRDRIVACLTELMAATTEGHLEFNTMLLVDLVELRAIEAAESIERAFAGDLVDVGMLGDWEVVRGKLGVEGLGLKMPAHPHNSIERLRTQMGIGIFSDRPIFARDEIDHDAEEGYYERAHDAFSKSTEAQRVVDRCGGLGWYRMLLEFGLNDLGETVDAMTLGSVTEFVLDYIPRKVSTQPDAADAIVCELAMFWEYLNRVYELPEAKLIIEWLSAEGMVARLKTELSDTSNYGMAKSMVMLGNKAGYDMSSEAGLSEFMMAYNRSLLSDKHSVAKAPVDREHRVGRNDPCPCGSGKKFKKCCR